MIGRLKAAVGIAVAAAALTGSGHSQAAQTPDAVTPGGHHLHVVLPKGVTREASGRAAASSNNLAYSGGPVEAAGTVNYAIFWEPPLNGVSATYNSLITRFLQDIGGTGLYGVATQYYQQSGGTTTYITNSSSFGGSWVDTTPFLGPVVTDAQIQAEVSKAMAANHWTGGIGHQFFVFTGRNEFSCAGVECSNAVFCAYHSSFGSGAGEVLYANQPYTNTLPAGCQTPTSPNNDIDADSTINVVSHELMETVTDPSVGNANYAWQDSSGAEIGDKCNFNFGPTNAQGADLVANGHPYIVQQEWSNRVSGCSMS